MWHGLAKNRASGAWTVVVELFWKDLSISFFLSFFQSFNLSKIFQSSRYLIQNPGGGVFFFKKKKIGFWIFVLKDTVLLYFGILGGGGIIVKYFFLKKSGRLNSVITVIGTYRATTTSCTEAPFSYSSLCDSFNLNVGVRGP